MPDRIIQRTKIAEGLAVLAVIIALIGSSAGYLVNKKNLERVDNARAEVAYITCLDQNKRHIDSMAYLHRLAFQLERDNPSPAFKKTTEEGIQRFEFLFRALAPVQNCTQVVKERYGKTLTGGLSEHK